MGNLDHEALKLIQETAIGSASVEVITIAGEPDNVYWLSNRVSGELIRREAAPKPRQHYVERISHVAALIVRYVADSDVRAVAFVSAAGIVALLDERTRRDRVTMPLTVTSQWLQLVKLSLNSGALADGGGHRDVLNLLRIHLAGAVNQADLLRFSELKFSSEIAGKASAKPGAVHVSNDVMRTATFEGQPPPDMITFSVYVYEQFTGPNRRQNVRCNVAFDVEEQLFNIQPLAGELESARQATHDQIITDLGAALNTAGALQESGQVLIVSGSPE